MAIANWMSWEGGVDLVAIAGGAEQPNVIVHVARMVHTPVGSAPAGMVLIPNQENPTGPPALMGFISHNEKVGAYFGPKIFAGTPFEHAPVLVATIEVESSSTAVSAKISVGDFRIETRLSNLRSSELVNREPGALPFVQQGVECVAGTAELTVNGRKVEIVVPPVGVTGGPAAVSAPCGIYARE